MRIICKHFKPLNRKKATKVLKRIYDLLENKGINPKICYGTLLGAIREKQLIETDGDIDLIIMKEHQKKAERIIKRKIKTEEFLCEDDIIKIKYLETPIDIYCLTQNGIDTFLSRYTWRHGYKKRFIELIYLIDNNSHVTINNKAYMTLNYPIEWIERTYGKDWKTPQLKKGNTWTLTTKIRYFLTEYRQYKIREFKKKLKLIMEELKRKQQ